MPLLFTQSADVSFIQLAQEQDVSAAPVCSGSKHRLVQDLFNICVCNIPPYWLCPQTETNSIPKSQTIPSGPANI